MINKKRINQILWGCCFILSLYFNHALHSQGDDYIFAQGIARYGSFLKWEWFYATNWSGRLIPHGILVILLQFPNWVFVLLNSFFIVATLYLFIELFVPSTVPIPALYGLGMMCSLLLMKRLGFFITEVILWKCASVLYLWSITGFFLAIYPVLLVFRGEFVKRFQWLLAYIGGIYASSFEQMAAFMMVFLLLLTLWNSFVDKRSTKQSWQLSIVIAAFSVFFCLVPGNYVRLQSELIQWMPYYGMFNTTEKVLLGLFRCLEFIRDYAIITIFPASVIEYVIIVNRRKYNKWICCLSAEPMIYYALALVNRIINSDSITKMTGMSLPRFNRCFQILQVSNTSIIFENYIISTMVAMLSVLVFGCLLFLASVERGCDPIKPMLFFGSCGTIVLMGFSPTIIASGERTSFICFVFCAFILLLLYWETNRTLDDKLNTNTSTINVDNLT